MYAEASKLYNTFVFLFIFIRDRFSITLTKSVNVLFKSFKFYKTARIRFTARWILNPIS